MSNKRQAQFQGGSERYGGQDSAGDMADMPQKATAAQMARRTIAQARKPSGSQRSSRAGTPTAFGQQPAQQSMPSFQPPAQSGNGFGSDFSFSVNAPSNPFAQMNGAASTPPPTNFQFGGGSDQTIQNGGGGIFGNTNPSFGSTFGSTNSQQPQQNGFNPSTTLFGQNQNDSSKGNTSALFAGFGQSDQSQPQQNGLTPSTNNSFPSFGKQNSDNPFKGFGQSQQQTQSTANTSFSFGQSAQPNGDNAPSTPFPFGKTNVQSQSSTAKPPFGSTSEAEQTPKTATSTVFSSFGQQNEQKGEQSLFPSTSQPEQTPKPTMSGLFGSQPSATKSLFGATPPPESGTNTPKPGESVFGSLNQSRNNGISAGMFTQSREQTPKPSTDNIFGAVGQQPEQNNVNAAAEQTPKPGGLFGGLNQSQPNGVKPNLFSNTLTSQPEQQTPKPSAGLFGGSFGQQQTLQPTTTPTFKFGQSVQDTSMTTPGNTPQKLTGSTQPQAAASEESSAGAFNQTPAAQGGSLFDRITPRDNEPATAQKSLFHPATSLFTPSAAPTPATNNESLQTPGGQGGSLFDRANPHDTPATAIKPSTSLPNQPSERTAAPWISHGPAAAKAASMQQSVAPSASSQTAPATSTDVISAAEKKTLRVLNEGLRKHLANQDPDADWTSIMVYYAQQAAKIRKRPEPKFDTSAIVAPATPAPTTGPSSTQQAPSSAFPSQQSRPSAPAPTPSAGNLFSSVTPQAPAPTFHQTPKPSGPSSLLKPPQTAPVNKKRPAEDDIEQPPATEKRARSNEPTTYPKLPENASETAKLFQAALDKSSNNTTPALMKSSTAAETQEKERQEREARDKAEKEAREKAEKEKKEAEEKAKQADTPKFGGFKPSITGFTPSAPSALSGMPTFSAPATSSGGFLAAFGKKAGEQEEKERKKRKAEDYDSDEETEEAWAERDKAEQQAKRQKILDAAKSGFGFTPSAGNTPAPESDIGEGSEKASERGDDTDAETPPMQSKSMFDRFTPRDPPATAPSKSSLFSADTSKANANLFAPKTPSGLGVSSMTTSNIFSQFSKPRESIEKPEEDKTEAEKDQGTGDHTWKPNTPIKFGGNTSTATESTTPAAPPPLGNLFGTATQKPSTDSTGHLNVPKPNFGFNFGAHLSSAGTSRASTPGITTDNEGASTAGEDAEEDEQPPPEPQVEDQTGLRESEKESEDLLYSVHMAKAMKWGEKKNDAGDMVWGWVDKGKGPVYILKHKETGKVRLVLKVPPYGAPRMNFEPLKNVEYEVQGGSGKMVQGIFVDHMDEKNPGRLSKWLIQVGKPEDAKEMARVLMENRAT